jgi:chromosome partitioning protein
VEVIAIINQKGGVGKSTTALALGAGLFLKGYKVLFVDTDAQGNLTDTAEADNSETTVMELLTGEAQAKETIQQGERWDIISSSPSLAGADMTITGKGREYKLKKAIELIKGEYDYIIIDTPPVLGILMVNALTACDIAIIPTQADRYSLKGIAQLHATIETIKKHSNPTLRIKGILLTRYSPRAVLSRDIAEVIDQTAQKLQTKLFKAKIREAIAIKESQAQRVDIFAYAPKSNAAKDYDAFIDELLRS